MLHRMFWGSFVLAACVLLEGPFVQAGPTSPGRSRPSYGSGYYSAPAAAAAPVPDFSLGSYAYLAPAQRSAVGGEEEANSPEGVATIELRVPANAPGLDRWQCDRANRKHAILCLAAHSTRQDLCLRSAVAGRPPTASWWM